MTTLPSAVIYKDIILFLSDPMILALIDFDFDFWADKKTRMRPVWHEEFRK